MWERGFDIFKTSKSGNQVKKTVPELRKILLGCEDFKNEVGALEQIVIERGHLLIMSPKGHPELAGVGIEYGWGHAKYLFRKNNTMVVKEKLNGYLSFALRASQKFWPIRVEKGELQQ